MPFDPSSWDLGPAHIISFSTEVYFFLSYGRHLVERQFHWLESDLQVTWVEVPYNPPPGLPSLPHPRPSFWALLSRKPIRTGQPGRGSLPWATGPCTVPMLIWMTVRGMRAR